MGVIEIAGIEQADSAVIAVGVHDHENTMCVGHDAAQEDIFDRVDLSSENGWWRSAGRFLSPLRGLFTCSSGHPRLAPWAAIFRRFAAGLLSQWANVLALRG